MKKTDKLQVKEVIVVEGRDDTNAVLRAIEGITIETHGFGIRQETWTTLETAYREKGLIIFTDPDHAGEEIRKKLTQRFPESKQAYLIRDLAEKKGDIGIENAAPQDIIDAIKKAHFTNENAESLFSMEDLYRLGCIGQDDSKATRQKLGQALGIGYGNGKAFLNKLNRLGITRDELDQRWKEIKG